MRTGILCFVLLAGGFTAAFALFSATPAASPRPAPTPATPTPVATETEDLGAIDAESAAIRAQLRALPPPDAPLAALRRRLEAARPGREVEVLLALVREAAALGEAGYALALEAALLLDIEKGGPFWCDYRKPGYRALWAGAMEGFAEWLLVRPSEVPSALRLSALDGLMGAMSERAPQACLKALAAGDDPEIARFAALGWLRDELLPSMTPLILEAAKAQAAHPDLRWSLIQGLGRLGTPEARAATATLAASGDEGQRSEAAVVLAALDSGGERASAIWTSKRNPQSEPEGLEWGDVLVSAGTTTVANVEQFRGLVAAHPDGEVVVTVQRRGRLVQVRLEKEGGRLWKRDPR